MKAKNFLIFFGSILFLSSCATQPTKIDPNYQAYLETQKAIAQNPPKIVEIDAQPGQTIELKGVSKFVVYNVNGRSMGVAVYRPQPNPATVIFTHLFDTALDASKSILPTYFGWHYGSHILTKAFDRAGGNYNVQGDYNTGTMTKVTGDYVPGTKYQVGADYVGADKVQGNKVGQNNYQPGQDYVGSNKTGADYVGADKVQGNKVGQNNYQPGQDYVGSNKTGADYVGQNKTQGDYTGGNKDLISDNSTQ